jgi:hypothetical protein
MYMPIGVRSRIFFRGFTEGIRYIYQSERDPGYYSGASLKN